MTAASVPKAIIKDNASYTFMLSPPVGGTDLADHLPIPAHADLCLHFLLPLSAQ